MSNQNNFLQERDIPSDISDSSETRSERESIASEVPTPFHKCIIKPEILLKTTKIDGELLFIKFIVLLLYPI